MALTAVGSWVGWGWQEENDRMDSCLPHHSLFDMAQFVGQHAQLFKVDQAFQLALVALVEKGQVLDEQREEGDHWGSLCGLGGGNE